MSFANKDLPVPRRAWVALRSRCATHASDGIRVVPEPWVAIRRSRANERVNFRDDGAAAGAADGVVTFTT